jgi:hypothetical protein
MARTRLRMRFQPTNSFDLASLVTLYPRDAAQRSDSIDGDQSAWQQIGIVER